MCQSHPRRRRKAISRRFSKASVSFKSIKLQLYAKGVPLGDNQEPIQDAPPPVRALVSRLSENATTSSVVSVTHDTTALEVSAVAFPVLFRWVTTGDTQASITATNFDHVIPPNTVRRFIIPIEAIANQTSVQGMNRSAGLFQRYAWATNGAGSVLSTEYGKNNSY